MPTTRKQDAARKRRNALAAERRRLKKLLRVEAELWEKGAQYIAGVDEAGRGPLAGPVVAAAVIMPPHQPIRGVNDSKQLTPEARLRLADQIRRTALAVGIGAASAREVDRLNILRATHLAICRAVQRLPIQPEHVLVDGLPVRGLCEHTAIVDGDAHVHGIACASILAKVLRDSLMARLSQRYPGFGWEHNCGYGTPEHREAIARLGHTPHHRLTFSGLQYTLNFELSDAAPAAPLTIEAS